MELEGVFAVQEAHFAVIIIANICSEHSVQALKGENVTVCYSGETRTCTFDSLLPIPLLFPALRSCHWVLLTRCCIANYIVYHGNKNLLHSMFKNRERGCPPASWDAVRHRALNELHASVGWSAEVVQVGACQADQGRNPVRAEAVLFPFPFPLVTPNILQFCCGN